MKPVARFGKNVARLTTGSAASQLLLIASTPLLARQYSPAEFGALAIFTASNAILAGISTLKYDTAIILPKQDSRAVNLFHATLSVAFAFSILIGAAIGLVTYLSGFSVPRFLFLLPVAIWLSVACSCMQQLGARSAEYRYLAKSQVLNAAVTISVALAISAASTAPQWGLVFSYVAGIVASFTYLAWNRSLYFRHRLTRIHLVRINELLAVMKIYRQFPIYVMPSAFLGLAGSNALPLLLKISYSLKDIGHFSMANRFLVSPSSIVGGAVSEAFRSELVARQRDFQPLAPFFKHILLSLLKIGVPTYIIFALAAPFALTALLGPEFERSGYFAQLLCAGVFFQFLSQPFVSVFIVTNSTKYGLLVQSLSMGIPLASLALISHFQDLPNALMALSIANVGTSIFTLVCAYKLCEENDRNL